VIFDLFRPTRKPRLSSIPILRSAQDFGSGLGS
jgi:hypothetical protein